MLRDAGFGVVLPLVLRVPPRVIRAHHLHHEVRPAPVVVLAARVFRVEQRQQIGLAELALADAKAQRGAEHDAATFAQQRMQREREREANGLMEVGWHGQYL